MLQHPTLEKLQALKFTGMVAALADQIAMPDIDELSFEERLGLLVDREITERENRRLTNRLRRARLSTHRHNYNNVSLTAGRIFGYGCSESVSGNNHAEKKSFRDHAHRRGSTSAEAAGAKIYVAVFSGSTGPDDPLGRTRTAER